jgi:hypothetical protein
MKKTNTLYYLLIGLLMVIVQTIPAFGQSLKEIYATGTVAFVAEMTIDESTLPEDEFFEGIVDIGADVAGNIYLCDIQACNIKKFSAEGKFLKIIGRKGQGPGEFNMPSRMAVTGERLFIYDMGNRRLCALTTDGEYIKSIGIQNTEGQPRNMRAHPRGDVIIEREIVHYQDQDRPQDCVIQVFSPELELKKTISTHQVLRNKFRTIQGMFSNIIQPFTPDVFWDVAPDGKIVIGLAKDYTIETHHFEKGLLSSFKHTYEAVKVTDHDKEQFFSGITFSTSEGGDSELPKEIKKLTEFPKTKPAFDALFVDFEGNILVHPVRKDPEGSSPKCDAFAPEGKFIGTVNITGLKAFPRGALMGKGFVWVIERDEEDQVQVVKYRITPGKNSRIDPDLDSIDIDRPIARLDFVGQRRYVKRVAGLALIDKKLTAWSYI